MLEERDKTALVYNPFIKKESIYKKSKIIQNYKLKLSN